MFVAKKKKIFFYVYLERDGKILNTWQKNTHNIIEYIRVFLVEEFCSHLISSRLVIFKAAHRLQSKV